MTPVAFTHPTFEGLQHGYDFANDYGTPMPQHYCSNRATRYPDTRGPGVMAPGRSEVAL
jgi:hypothetical protein